VDSHALDDMVKVKKVLELAKQKKRNEKIVAMVDAAAKNEIKEVRFEPHPTAIRLMRIG
jgi:predicted HAD superfamily hydrolase